MVLDSDRRHAAAVAKIASLLERLGTAGPGAGTEACTEAGGANSGGGGGDVVLRAREFLAATKAAAKAAAKAGAFSGRGARSPAATAVKEAAPSAGAFGPGGARSGPGGGSGGRSGGSGSGSESVAGPPRCTVCGRAFAADRLSVHVAICRRLAAKAKRPAFSSKAKRLKAFVAQVISSACLACFNSSVESFGARRVCCLVAPFHCFSAGGGYVPGLCGVGAQRAARARPAIVAAVVIGQERRREPRQRWGWSRGRAFVALQLAGQARRDAGGGASLPAGRAAAAGRRRRRRQRLCRRWSLGRRREQRGAARKPSAPCARARAPR